MNKNKTYIPPFVYNPAYFQELDYTCFDSEVLELIEALALVPIGSHEYRYHLALIACSNYAKYHFCDRYKDFIAQRERNRRFLCDELYKRNKKYSRYVYDSYQGLKEMF